MFPAKNAGSSELDERAVLANESKKLVLFREH